MLSKQEPYADTTLESPLNGRRRCKDVWEHVLISQASGQSKAYVKAFCLSYVIDFYQSIICTLVFICL